MMGCQSELSTKKSFCCKLFQAKCADNVDFHHVGGGGFAGTLDQLASHALSCGEWLRLEILDGLCLFTVGMQRQEAAGLWRQLSWLILLTDA